VRSDREKSGEGGQVEFIFEGIRFVSFFSGTSHGSFRLGNPGSEHRMEYLNKDQAFPAEISHVGSIKSWSRGAVPSGVHGSSALMVMRTNNIATYSPTMGRWWIFYVARTRLEPRECP
jgi:hypothetical protein